MNKEKDFKEQYPSLSNSHIDKDGRVHCLSIMNHCKDNQIIKDALVKCQSDKSMGEYGFDNRYMIRVLKELGLE